MIATESYRTRGFLLDPTPQRFVETSAEQSLPASRSVLDNERNQKEQERTARWRSVIDSELSKIACLEEDEDFDVPNLNTVSNAVAIAERFCSEGFPPPDRVTVDSCGGIVFERGIPDSTLQEVLHVWDDGTIEVQLFETSRLISRELIRDES